MSRSVDARVLRDLAPQGCIRVARTHGAAYLAEFIERQLANGFVADALVRHDMLRHGMAHDAHIKPLAAALA